MKYKIVPGPKSVEGNPCSVFEDIINQNAVDGWKYHSMETIESTNKGGCFRQPSVTSLYMLIFEKDE